MSLHHTSSLEGIREPVEAVSRRSSTTIPYRSSVQKLYRPFVIPLYDPEHTNMDPPTQSIVGLQPMYPYPHEDNFTLKEQLHFNWYTGQDSVSTSRCGSSNRSAQSLLERRLSFGSTSSSLLASKLDYDTCEQVSHSVSRHASGADPQHSSLPLDGGRQAWLHVLAGLLVVFNAQGLNMSFGIFQAYYEKVLLPGTSSSKIAWIGSVQIFFLFFMSLMVSPAVEKGFYHLCFHGGSLLLLTSIFVTSFCKSWWQLFLVQGIITGIAMGSVFSSGLMVLLTYFSRRLSIATGIAAAGAPLGGIFFPLLARSAVGHIGFGWTIRTFALVNLITMTAANAIIRPRPRPRIVSRKYPKRYDSLPVGQQARTSFDRLFALMAAGMFFTFWGFYITYYYIVLYAEDVLQLKNDTAVNLLIAMNAANLAGRILPSVISDSCIGPLNTITPWTMVASMLSFSWVAATNPSGLFLIACFYGFTSSAVQGLYTSTIVGFAGPRRSKEAAKRIGVILAIIGLAVLTGAPIAGALITSKHGDYLYAQMFAGSTLSLGGLLFLAARLSKSGWKPDRV